jgi:hypothetical protein
MDSGIEFETPLWAVFTMLRGTVTRIEWFLDRAQALEAVGLSSNKPTPNPDPADTASVQGPANP